MLFSKLSGNELKHIYVAFIKEIIDIGTFIYKLSSRMQTIQIKNNKVDFEFKFCEHNLKKNMFKTDRQQVVKCQQLLPFHQYQ